MKPIVTAVIVTYWEERFPQVQQIVGDLLAGEVTPDSILIFNNSEKKPNIKGATVIQGGDNFTSRAKYGAAMLVPSDYYILLDDDVTVGRGTLRRFMDAAYKGCCYATVGFQFEDRLSEGVCIDSREIKAHTKVNSFNGFVQFLSWRAIVNMFEAEEKCRLETKECMTDGEDILIALANESFILPMHGEDQYKHLSTGDVGMYLRPNYSEVRDIFAYKSQRVLAGLEIDRSPIALVVYGRSGIEYDGEILRTDGPNRAAAINNAVARVKSPLVAIVDGDVRFDPYLLAHAQELLAFYPWVIPYAKMIGPYGVLEGAEEGFFLLPKEMFFSVGGFDVRIPEQKAQDYTFVQSLRAKIGRHGRPWSGEVTRTADISDWFCPKTWDLIARYNKAVQLKEAE